MKNTKRTVIARGRTAEVLEWNDGQVLKLFYAWLPAGAIEQEIRAARLVSGTNLPVPKLLGEESLEGRRGLIFERVAGASMLTLLGARPWACVRYACQFAELHTAIHRQKGSGLPSLKEGLEKNFSRIKDLPPELLSSALNHLSVMPDGDVLCHFDFHPDQVLMRAAGPVVLDWMTAYSGQPAADVARTKVLICYGAMLDAGWLMQQLVTLLRGIFFRAYLRHYLELNPAVTISDIDAWLPLVALARLAEGIPGEKDKLQDLLLNIIQ